MKFLILNGTSCSGKTTILRSIMESKEHLFLLSSDSIKWLFSNYTSPTYKSDVQKVLFAIASQIFVMGYDVVCDSALWANSRQALINLAKKNNYDVLEINLEAEYSVLENRFDKRVATALTASNTKISNTSKKRFKELFNLFEHEKNLSALTF